ncbi:hypothetical protein VP01_3243g1, partial [Puccinia sorghi]
EQPVGILCDIGCLLDKYINLVRTLTLHYDCRPSSWINRLLVLLHRCKYHNRQSILNLGELTIFSIGIVAKTKISGPGPCPLGYRGNNSDGIGAATESGGITQLISFVHSGPFKYMWKLSRKMLMLRRKNQHSSLDQVINGGWLASLFDLNEILTVIKEKEVLQKLASASLWRNYEELCQTEKTELGMQPLTTVQLGNILGKWLKEQILAAIKRRKAPVEKEIKLLNDWRAHLQKANLCQLALPENQDLTFANFLKIYLDNTLWNDGHFYHAQLPWVTNPQVRRGIKAVLLLDQVEEEIELLTQELNRKMTWACQYCNLMLHTLDKLEAASRKPIDSNNQFVNILPSFPMKRKARLLIWNHTCSAHTKPNHMWFDVIKVVKENLAHREIWEIDDALEKLYFVDNQSYAPEVEGDAETKGLDSGKEEMETKAAIVGSSVQDIPVSVDEEVGRDQ